MQLKSKTIFITGATSGFGRACAETFASEGARLVLTGRRTERLAELEKSLPSTVHTITLDVRDREAVFKAVENLPEEFAAIDVLVNNAGLALGLSPSHEASLADWEQMVDTNIKGVLYCTRAILPGMVRRRRGHIINIGSIAGNYAYPGGNTYGATKAFLKQFSLNLRADLLGHPIRVTNIEPGMAETEFSLVRYHGDAARAGDVYKGLTPLSAQDVAETVRWCAALPAHVNINRLEVMPVMQAPGGPAVKREG